MRYSYILLIIILIIAGCSGGGDSPLKPDEKSVAIDQLPIIGLSGSDDSLNAIGLNWSLRTIDKPIRIES